jgi:hypothetical protein
MLRHQLGIALGVGVVQRRVHLVKQAKRRRVELKDGKHQSNRGKGFFAAREQVDGLVFLARRLGDHLNTRIQNFVAGHHQLRGATAEQLREHARRNGR